MALFLSSGLMEPACDALLRGGFKAETPAAVVYKASWPEQKILRGTLADIARQAETEGIRSTALILVGNFLGKCYSLSKLYDGAFSHGFRKASK